MDEVEYEKLAKCTCGCMLLWIYTEYGDYWAHWRPPAGTIDPTISHKLVESSEFLILAKDFEEWNKKTPEELQSHLTSMTEFWKDTK